MCGFEDFYNDTSRHELDENIEWDSIYPLDIFYANLLKEYQFTTLIKKTDMERLRKAENEVRTKPPISVDMGKGKEKLEFNFKSKPTTEGKRHKGYLIHKDGKVIEVYCNCADFFYRLWEPLFKKGLSRYNPMLKYGRYDPRVHAPSYEKQHSQEPPVVMNPDGKLHVCKHLAALKNYI
jgi:hypothetical protein